MAAELQGRRQWCACMRGGPGLCGTGYMPVLQLRAALACCMAGRRLGLQCEGWELSTGALQAMDCIIRLPYALLAIPTFHLLAVKRSPHLCVIVLRCRAQP